MEEIINSHCKKTLSGRHYFIETEKTSFSGGEEKIIRKTVLGGLLPDRIDVERSPRQVNMEGTGEFRCSYCGIIKDIEIIESEDN